MKENTEKHSTAYWIRTIAYWITTGIIVLETAAGSEWDLVRNPYVTSIMARLGYPVYILTIMGAWKIFGAIALVVPRFPRVKEWAYAGLFFIYTGGAVSQLFMGYYSDALGPFVFALITMASWYLRPPSRKLLSI